MKFTVAALLAALATTCFAQTVNITSPPNDACVAPGQDVDVLMGYDPSEMVSLYTAGWFTKKY